MQNIDFQALASKYLGSNSPIQKRVVTAQNVFLEDCEDGFLSAEVFTKDLKTFKDDVNSINGLRIFPEQLSSGKTFYMGDVKPDVADNEYYWVKIYHGRRLIEFKLPNLPWIMEMIASDRSVKFSLTFEEMFQRASEILEQK
ncbi:hypothetical protein [Sphingobacterium mizutaii]|uniref:hypothetical protein n=1 Tax=Sphingobacterium mizutaii TaxID=1010 RepID=UPI00162A5A9B|nr:hypothetical protein [Sphingobacterium mizutaii]